MSDPTASPPTPTSPPAALLTAWMAHTHDLLALTDASGRVLWSNPAFDLATGETAPFDLLDLAPPDWRGGAPRRALATALQSGIALDTVLVLRANPGTELQLLVRLARAGDEWLWTFRQIGLSVAEPRPVDASAALGRVSEWVERTHRAEQRASRLQAATEAARIGIWTSVVGTRQTEWNAQMYVLFDMVGTPEPPTLGEWIARCVHPDDVARVEQITRAYTRRETSELDLEFRIRLRDGRTRWMVLRAGNDPHGGDGLRVFGIAMDVTDRRAALTALHTASERAALIARHAGIGTWETDELGLPAVWDEQMFRLRGLEPSPRALDREERLALVHPDDRTGLLDVAPDVSLITQPTANEFRVRLPDGSYRWLASRSTTLRDEHGKVVRRVGVNWDITEAKSAEIARQQALLAARESQAKSHFLSRMSHELRTPLNAVLGFTQLMQLEAQQSPASVQLDKLGHIRTAGEHLLTLIDDALDLSSLESGTLRLNLQPVSVASVVAQALPLVGELARAHGVTVSAGVLEGTALADPTRLRQVLINLLTNAIKYNHRGGLVAIESSKADAQVRISLRDTGRGMRPDQLAHLFEPFNRLGRESEGIEGSGIGLTIVKALVEGMGGRIGVTSQPGRGTVFDVSLPAHDNLPIAPAPVAESLAAVPPPMRGRGRERSGQLLYIEDNSVNVLLVEELVKTLSGLKISSEATGAAGVARAHSLLPDLILIDMQLPDFDGFEVLRQLRADPATARIPCIALSANAMPEDIERGLASGFDDYWTKPIKFGPFLDELERLFPAA